MTGVEAGDRESAAQGTMYESTSLHNSASRLTRMKFEAYEHVATVSKPI